MTDETDSSVVLAELFREYSTQRLSSQGRPFSCSPDPVTDLLKQLWSPHQLEQDLVLLVYYPLQQTSPFSVMLLLISVSLRRIGFRSSSGTDCSSELHCHHNSHGCIVMSSIPSICLRISCSSVTHFPDLPWIVEDLPCFSEVRSFSSWYALLLLFCVVFFFRQVSISALSTYPVLFCFLH